MDCRLDSLLGSENWSVRYVGAYLDKKATILKSPSPIAHPGPQVLVSSL